MKKELSFGDKRNPFTKVEIKRDLIDIRSVMLVNLVAKIVNMCCVGVCVCVFIVIKIDIFRTHL